MGRVLVFVPGIMASCLRVPAAGGGHLRLWHEGYRSSLKQIASNPGLYKWNPHTTAEAYDILTHASVFVMRRDIYGTLRKTLRGLGGYEHAEFPYDWRRDVRETAGALGRFLEGKGFARGADGRQLKEDGGPRLSIVAHSMGGLVASLALLRGHIHPDNVETFVTIGTPFRGAHAGFKALYDTGYLTGMGLFTFALNWRRDRRKCKQILLGAIQSFQSVYQLLPPDEEFVDIPSGDTISPLAEERYADVERLRAARETHAELAGLDGLLKKHPSLRTLFIYGDREESTDWRYSASVAPTGVGYDDVACYRWTKGDGTVPVKSANAYKERGHAVAAADHPYMCGDKLVLEQVVAFLS